MSGQAQQRPATSDSAAAGSTILVVDDNPVNLKLAKVLLVSSGYQVATADDAEKALAAIKQYLPRLILMDVQLPGMDGLELTRRLKADPATRSIIIVAVTAYAMMGDRQRALDAGCDGYVAKPLDTRALPGVLAQFLGETARPEGTAAS